MDYYSKQQYRRKQAILTVKRKQFIKDTLTVVVALPLLWLSAVVFLSI